MRKGGRWKEHIKTGAYRNEILKRREYKMYCRYGKLDLICYTGYSAHYDKFCTVKEIS